MKQFTKLVLAVIVSMGLALAIKNWGAGLILTPPRDVPAAGQSNNPGTEAPPADGPSDWLRCDKSGNSLDGCFLWIPGGAFLMGAQARDPWAPGYDNKAQPDEGPPRKVTVDGFWLQAIEVQVNLYRQCVDEGECAKPDFADKAFFAYTRDPNTGRTVGMNGVTWKEATIFCAYLGGQLPTEAEWEYAARGAAGYRFPWGDHKHCADRSGSVTLGGWAERDAWGLVVDKKKLPIDDAGWEGVDCSHSDLPNSSSAYRLEDSELELMAGGMWEWVADYYEEDYYERGPNRDPQGPATGTKRVQRGGGWMSDLIWDFRAAGRASLDPELRLPDVGIRCAWSKAK
jgi:iron(II)-dependent oxidoreductase